MLLGAAIVRAFMRQRADDAGLAIFPPHRLDAGHVAQFRVDAGRGDQQPGLQRRAVGQMHGDAGAVGVEGADGKALDDVDAELFGTPAQGAVQIPVGHHMRERLAGRHLAVEGEKHRAHRIGRARIGDDHVGDRLRLRCDLVPDLKLLQHAAGGGGDRRGAAVPLPDAGGRGVDHGDGEAGTRLLQRHGAGQADIAGAGDEHVERGRGSCVRLAVNHGKIPFVALTLAGHARPFGLDCPPFLSETAITLPRMERET